MSDTNLMPVMPVFDLEVVGSLYTDGEHVRLAGLFLEVLGFFEANTALYFTVEEQNYIHAFINVFLNILAEENFDINIGMARKYISFNVVISNLVSLTPLKNTDLYLEKIRKHKNWFVKVLVLYSARNTVLFNERDFFEVDRDLASYWYCAYAVCCYSGLVDEVVCRNLKRHYLIEHPGLNPFQSGIDIVPLYFASTYLDGVVDRSVKSRFNNVVSKNYKIINGNAGRSDMRKVGVFSRAWRKSHSVYRNYWAYLNNLKESYELVFFKLSVDADCDVSLFHKVYTFDRFQEMVRHKSLLSGDFGIFYFPDVGMSVESIILANCRVAPIQVCSPGHSVSTFGSKVDYFISGYDVESSVAAENNYSEKLVLIPGMGVIHNTPDYNLIGNRKKTSTVVINCSWYSQKVNYYFVCVLKKMVEQFRRKVIFRIFLGDSVSKRNDYLAFASSLVEQLGTECIELYVGLGYQGYMELMEEGDLSIESFHFGGCNTVSDSLYVRVPMISWEGDKWYNRIGSQMLRVAGLQDCIATSEVEFINKTAWLVNNDGAREDVKSRLSKVDLDKTIYSKDDAKYFTEAFNYLVKNHNDQLGAGHGQPIIIERC